MLRSLDLFSGVGGLTRALHGLAQPVAYCERDPTAQAVLRRLMATGRLPAAPVCDDVTALDRTWLARNARVKGAGIDMIMGGFPCVGFSALGKRQGFENEQSSLFAHVLRLVDQLAPPCVFLENVVGIVKLGLHAVAKELGAKRGYELRWVTVSAEQAGAPQLRPRWYCLAVKPGFRHAWAQASPYRKFDWSAERMPPRMVRTCPKPRSCRQTMALMGNSVVPDAVRYAFLHLAKRPGAPDAPHAPHAPPPAASPSLATPAGWALTPAAPKQAAPRSAAWPAAGAWPTCGLLTAGPRGALRRCRGRLPPLQLPPRLNLVFDPAAYRASKPPSASITTERIKAPVPALRWATPRYGITGGSNYLTARTIRDLVTQVRFERSTDKATRAGSANPAFCEWLMGYPRGWTAQAPPE